MALSPFAFFPGDELTFSGQPEGSRGLRKTRFDVCLIACVALISALQFGLFPILLEPGLTGAVALVLLAAATEPLHYGLMHESIHGNLLPGEKWNRFAGRALGIALGLPWETMRFGHLAHHGFNRHDFDRPEALAPGQSRRRGRGTDARVHQQDRRGRRDRC